PADQQVVLKSGFAMTADDTPEVVTLANDAGYVLVGVDRISEAAPAPLAQIKEQVRQDWIQRKANERAQAVASAIEKKVGAGVPIEKARAEAGPGVPPVQSISARRIQIGQAPPEAAAPLRMLFSLT